jgi:hypothetical protein
MYFLDMVHQSVVYLKQRFGDWALSASSGKKPTHLGSISRASPYLQTMWLYNPENHACHLLQCLEITPLVFSPGNIINSTT